MKCRQTLLRIAGTSLPMAENEEEPVVSRQECLKALEKIRRFLVFHKTLPDSGLFDIEDTIIRTPTKLKNEWRHC